MVRTAVQAEAGIVQGMKPQHPKGEMQGFVMHSPLLSKNLRATILEFALVLQHMQKCVVTCRFFWFFMNYALLHFANRYRWLN